MRTETQTRTLHTFAELSDDAKETARTWWRDAAASEYDYAEFIIDDATAIATILGIDIGGSRRAPCIYYSGFCSQGDGASFTGWYSYAKGASAAIRAYAPLDKELHRIADTLAATQRSNFYRLQATITQRSARYSHSGTMSADVSRTDCDDWSNYANDADAIETLMRDFADWIYRQLETSYDDSVSDSVIDDTIDANEYEFNSDGSIA